CGTQDLHARLEATIAKFLHVDDAILFAAAFDANGGVFEPLFDENDAIISDALNHASLIDGIRLCKAARYRYANNDMADLEAQLQAASAAGKRHKVIATDGAFSMDGTIAKLNEICDLADRYGALVMIDECHASGFMGATGRGTHEHHNVMGRVDIITGTLGKALGGAMGGFTSARKEVIDMLRQKSRPYLFSNTLAPSIAGASLAVLERLSQSTALRDRLHENTAYFRAEIARIGFTIKPGTHPVVPVMLFEAPVAQKFAARMYELGVLLSGFFYPVVPMGQARVRVQLSAAHTREQLDVVLKAFEQAGNELGLLNQAAKQ
ncbi:MAG: glycine C-acetyltransferase, partial [Duganella sp.]